MAVKTPAAHHALNRAWQVDPEPKSSGRVFMGTHSPPVDDPESTGRGTRRRPRSALQ